MLKDEELEKHYQNTIVSLFPESFPVQLVFFDEHSGNDRSFLVYQDSDFINSVLGNFYKKKPSLYHWIGVVSMCVCLFLF